MYSNSGGIADFGKYVVGSAVSNWADVPIKKEDRPPSRKEMYKAFLKGLNQSQTKLWRKYRRLEPPDYPQGRLASRSTQAL